MAPVWLLCVLVASPVFADDFITPNPHIEKYRSTPGHSHVESVVHTDAAPEPATPPPPHRRTIAPEAYIAFAVLDGMAVISSLFVIACLYSSPPGPLPQERAEKMRLLRSYRLRRYLWVTTVTCVALMSLVGAGRHFVEYTKRDPSWGFEVPSSVFRKLRQAHVISSDFASSVGMLSLALAVCMSFWPRVDVNLGSVGVAYLMGIYALVLRHNFRDPWYLQLVRVPVVAFLYGTAFVQLLSDLAADPAADKSDETSSASPLPSATSTRSTLRRREPGASEKPPQTPKNVEDTNARGPSAAYLLAFTAMMVLSEMLPDSQALLGLGIGKTVITIGEPHLAQLIRVLSLWLIPRVASRTPPTCFHRHNHRRSV